MGKGRAMFRFTPTMETVPPVAAHERASSTVASAPTASMTDSAPRLAARRCEHLFGVPGRGAAMGLGPEVLGPGQALGHHVDGEDARRAEERGALHRHDADGSEPHHHDGRARGDGGALPAPT